MFKFLVCRHLKIFATDFVPGLAHIFDLRFILQFILYLIYKLVTIIQTNLHKISSSIKISEKELRSCLIFYITERIENIDSSILYSV